MIQEKINAALSAAEKIASHSAFADWLALAVGEILPHTGAIICTGDFDAGNVRYSTLGQIATVAYPYTEHDYASFAVPRLQRRWHNHLHRAFVTPLPHPLRAPSYGERDINGYEILGHGVVDHRHNTETCFFFVLAPLTRQKNAKPTLSSLIPCLYRVFCQLPDWEPRMLDIASAPGRANLPPRKAQPPHAQATRPAIPCNLTAREQEIMHWVSEGKTNEEVGLILEITLNTVKNHMRRIFAKLEVSNRAQAVARLQSPG